MSEPYHAGHNAMMERMEGEQAPLTPEQMANTWFERVKERALEIGYAADFQSQIFHEQEWLQEMYEQEMQQQNDY